MKAHERALRTAGSLQHNRELWDAVLTYPSIATEIYPGVRAAPAIIAAGLMLIKLGTKVWDPSPHHRQG